MRSRSSALLREAITGGDGNSESPGNKGGDFIMFSYNPMSRRRNSGNQNAMWGSFENSPLSGHPARVRFGHSARGTRMGEPLAILTWALVLVTGGVSFLAFRRPDIEEALIFSPELILARKDYHRMLTSGFIHANWFHLGMNMYTLFVFGQSIELNYGAASLGLIYLSSIIGGSLLSLLIHRHHDYRAYGASGGVCGVLFAYIFLFPGAEIMMFPLPIGIPSWIYAVAFMLASFYGMKVQRDNIGHDAHLGGAVIGLLITTVLYPQIVRLSTGLYFTILGLSIAIFLYLVLSPLFLPGRGIVNPLRRLDKMARRAPVPKPPPSFEMDAILDKISRTGIDSLTREEHEFLLRASGKAKTE
jgi:membrane associated rhomboid family serine protease